MASLGVVFWPILLFFAVLDHAQLAPVAEVSHMILLDEHGLALEAPTTPMDSSANAKPIEETITITSTTIGLPTLTGVTESQSQSISPEESIISLDHSTKLKHFGSSENTATSAASSSETPITTTGPTTTSTFPASTSPETPSIVASASIGVPHAAATSEVLPITLRSPTVLENTTWPTESTTSQQFKSSTASSTSSSLRLSFTANHDVIPTTLSDDRKGKSLADEDKILAPTTLSFATSSHNSTIVLMPFNEEGLARKPVANLVAEQPREQATDTTKEDEGGVSVQIRETTSERSFANSTVTGSATSISSAEPRNSTMAKFTEKTLSECSIHLNSTLIQRSELFVPEALLSESDDLPASNATGLVASWATQKCTTIQAMLKPVNETCEKELVDRVPKFRSIALSNVWNYLCGHNATNLTALASQPLTFCVEALPTFAKTCATSNKLSFIIHWPSDLVLTPRVLKENDCRTLINTTSCLTEQIQQAKSKCEASQRQHFTAVMDILLKSMNCDQVQKNSKSAASTVQMYSMWTILLGMVVGGFFCTN